MENKKKNSEKMLLRKINKNIPYDLNRKKIGSNRSSANVVRKSNISRDKKRTVHAWNVKELKEAKLNCLSVYIY